MKPRPISLLFLSGSLRQESNNTTLLEAAISSCERPVVGKRLLGIDQLPHFNPDLDGTSGLPAKVVSLRDEVAHADGLIISCPEYASGVPGTLKNALDWLVGSTRFPGKLVAVWNASPRSHAAIDSLKLTLSTMAANIVDSACLTTNLLGKPQSVETLLADLSLRAQIAQALSSMQGQLTR